MRYLRIFYEVFRFIKRYRERQDVLREETRVERELEREHQRLLVESIGAQLVAFQTAQSSGVLALAEAASKQSDILSAWVKGFQAPAGFAPPVEETESYIPATENGLDDFLPKEFLLAYQLNGAPQPSNSHPAGFDREGSDF